MRICAEPCPDARVSPAPEQLRCVSGDAESSRPFDEAIDAAGAVRKPYRDVWPVVDALTPTRVRRAWRDSLRAFRGDNALHSVPRVLTAKEYDTLRRGVQQRATALRMFLQ